MNKIREEFEKKYLIGENASKYFTENGRYSSSWLQKEYTIFEAGFKSRDKEIEKLKDALDECLVEFANMIDVFKKQKGFDNTIEAIQETVGRLSKILKDGEQMKKPTIIINPPKMWWAGDNRVEEFMSPISDAIKKYHDWPSSEYTDIYNRAYKAIYYAIKKYSKESE